MIKALKCKMKLCSLDKNYIQKKNNLKILYGLRKTKGIEMKYIIFLKDKQKI